MVLMAPLALEIMKDIFELQNPPYNSRSSSNQFGREYIKPVHCGLQSVRYLGPIIQFNLGEGW